MEGEENDNAIKKKKQIGYFNVVFGVENIASSGNSTISLTKRISKQNTTEFSELANDGSYL